MVINEILEGGVTWGKFGAFLNLNRRFSLMKLFASLVCQYWQSLIS